MSNENISKDMLKVLRSTWRSMCWRCNPRHESHRNYHDRGISVCSEWLNSFEQFVKDMGPRPSPTHSLDRVDNDKGYSKANCRWATKHQQMANRRGRREVVAFGRRMRAFELADMIGQPRKIVITRLWRGWSVEEVLRGRQKVRRRLISERPAFYAQLSTALQAGKTVPEVAALFELSDAHVYTLLRQGIIKRTP